MLLRRSTYQVFAMSVVASHCTPPGPTGPLVPANCTRASSLNRTVARAVPFGRTDTIRSDLILKVGPPFIADSMQLRWAGATACAAAFASFAPSPAQNARTARSAALAAVGERVPDARGGAGLAPAAPFSGPLPLSSWDESTTCDAAGP